MFNPIEMRRRMVQERIEKSFDNEIEKAKHQVGEVHPNGKWIWTEYAPGKFDWKSKKGKYYKNGGSTASAASKTTEDKGYAERFKKNFKDASDDVLNKVISGKIQGTDADKRLAKEILDERKSSAEGEKYAAKIIDLLKVSSNKYSDIKKVTAFKTDKGNWAIDYDGATTGVILNGSKLSEKGLKAAGVKIEGATDNAKSKADSKQDKVAQDAGFKDYEEMSGWQGYVTAKNLLKKPSMKLKSKEADRKELEKRVADYEKNHADVIKRIEAKNGKKKAEEKKDEKANQTLTTDEKYVASRLAGKLVSNEWDYKPMKRSEILDEVAKFPDAQVYHFAISAIHDALNENGDNRSEYLKGAEDAMAELKYSRKKKDVSIVNYLNTAFDGYSVGGSLDDDKKKELDKFVNSSNYYKKSDIEKELDEATPEELKYIMVNALNYKVSSFKGGDMKGINHIIQEGVHKIKKNEGLSNRDMVSWYMLLDKDSEKPKNGGSKSDKSSNSPFSKYEDNGK